MQSLNTRMQGKVCLIFHLPCLSARSRDDHREILCEERS